jgi:hypothetical protein
MRDLREGATRASGAQHNPADAAQEVLRERAVGEPAPEPPPRPTRDAASLLRPQQQRDIVWRWHTRRRTSRV